MFSFFFFNCASWQLALNWPFAYQWGSWLFHWHPFVFVGSMVFTWDTSSNALPWFKPKWCVLIRSITSIQSMDKWILHWTGWQSRLIYHVCCCLLTSIHLSQENHYSGKLLGPLHLSNSTIFFRTIIQQPYMFPQNLELVLVFVFKL